MNKVDIDSSNLSAEGAGDTKGLETDHRFLYRCPCWILILSIFFMKNGESFSMKHRQGRAIITSTYVTVTVCVLGTFLFKMQAWVPQRCLLQRWHPALSLTAPPISSGNTSPILALNTHLGLVCNLATLWHCCNYVGQGLCSWQRKHSSYSTWVSLNESLYLVINFIIIQPLPLTPKFISQSKLAEIH